MNLSDFITVPVCKAEVDDVDLGLVLDSDEKIIWLDVTMYIVMIMQIFNTRNLNEHKVDWFEARHQGIQVDLQA